MPSSAPLRRATPADISALEALIEASVRGIGGRHYSNDQIERSLTHLFGVDRQLIDDGTYYVAEANGTIVGSGGWSRRQTPFGGDQADSVRDAALRDPSTDPAVIRAFFVHPAWTRRGIGNALLARCEQAARAEGFDHFELTATLSGHAFYRSEGYTDVREISIPLADGVSLQAIVMRKP